MNPAFSASSRSGRHAATGWSSSDATTGNGNCSPRTAAVPSSRRVSADRRSARRATTSRTDPGTATSSSSPASVARAQASSVTKNGLPLVARWTARPAWRSIMRPVMAATHEIVSSTVNALRRSLSVAGSRTRSARTACQAAVASDARVRSVARIITLSWRRRCTRCRNNSSDGSSARGRSSRTTTIPSCSASFRIRSVTASNCTNRAPSGSSAGDELPLRSAVGPAPRTCCQSQNGADTTPSGALPQTVGTPRWRASSASSEASRVLPMPGSPPHRTRRGRRSSAASSHSHNAASSRCRPMSSPCSMIALRFDVTSTIGSSASLSRDVARPDPAGRVGARTRRWSVRTLSLHGESRRPGSSPKPKRACHQMALVRLSRPGERGVPE
jgi:hypothetical protein